MLRFSTDFPSYYYFFCILLGLIYAFFLYKSNRIVVSRQITIMLFILRTLFITILAFLLLNPYAKSFVNTIEKPIVIVAER